MNIFSARLAYWSLLGLFFLGTFFILWSLVGSQPYIHDEAVYLTKARSWIEATPANEFGLYRPIGMAWMGWFFLQFSDAENFVRIFGAIFGAVAITFIYALFWRVFNGIVATSIVSIILTSPLFLRESTQFLNDVPSSGFLIGGLWLLYIYYESPEKLNALYASIFLFAFAFYIRYGVASTLAVIAVVTILALASTFLDKKNIKYPSLKNSLIISGGLFLPHFMHSLYTTGDLFGILILSGKVAGRKYLGEGLVSYVQWLPKELGGVVLGVTSIIGIVSTIIILARALYNKKLPQQSVGIGWLGGIGLLSLLLTGLLVHAEARYIFFSAVLLSGVGVASTYTVLKSYSKKIGDSVLMLLICFLFYFGFTQYNEVQALVKRKEGDRIRLAYEEVSSVISKDSANKGGCAIWAITTNRPALSWYSRCNTLRVYDPPIFQRDSRKYLKKVQYSLVFTKVTEPQITEDAAGSYGVNLEEIYRIKNLARGDLIVYRMEKKTSEDGGDEFNTHLDEDYTSGEVFVEPIIEE